MAKRPHKSKKNRRRRREPPAEEESDMETAILAAMHEADLPPEFSYAYRKTGLLGLAEDKTFGRRRVSRNGTMP